jgi:hypothetical protein
MDDIVTKTDRFLAELPPPDKQMKEDYVRERMLNGMAMLIDAVAEIEDLREALGKISTLSQNAAPGSYLEECGVLATSVLMRPL